MMGKGKKITWGEIIEIAEIQYKKIKKDGYNRANGDDINARIFEINQLSAEVCRRCIGGAKALIGGNWRKKKCKN